MDSQKKSPLQDTFNIVCNVEGRATDIAKNFTKTSLVGLVASGALMFVHPIPILGLLLLTAASGYATINKRKELLSLSKEFNETVGSLALKNDPSFRHLKDIAKEMDGVKPFGVDDFDLQRLWEKDKVHTGLMVAASLLIPPFLPLGVASLVGRSDSERVVSLRELSSEKREEMLRNHPGQLRNPGNSGPARP